MSEELVVHLRRAEPGLVIPPLHWKRAKRANGQRTALVACERGHVVSLSAHRIGPDSGRVWPSLICPTCGWHAEILLDGWEVEHAHPHPEA